MSLQRFGELNDGTAKVAARGSDEAAAARQQGRRQRIVANALAFGQKLRGLGKRTAADQSRRDVGRERRHCRAQAGIPPTAAGGAGPFQPGRDVRQSGVSATTHMEKYWEPPP